MHNITTMASNNEIDLRDIIFNNIISKKFTAKISTDCNGIIAGTKHAEEMLKHIGLEIEYMAKDGQKVVAGDVISIFTGTPKEISIAEERVIGKLSKFSGIATAANKAVQLAGGKCRVAAGGVKKMPTEIKMQIREAVEAGGAVNCLVDGPFVYLDKNYVRMFGGITQTLNAIKGMTEFTKIIQIKGITGSIDKEVVEAVKGEADVIMIDSGKLDDLKKVIKVLNSLNMRDRIRVAFSNGVQINDIPRYVEYGVELLCIGKQLVDSPLLDMKMDVIEQR